MEDSFRVRVDKVFGSLSSSTAATASSSSSSSLSSLWCLTDDEIKQNEWNRDKESPELESYPFEKGFLLGNNGENFGKDSRLEMEKDLDDLDNDDDDLDDQQAGALSKPDGYNDQVWEIKNSIGKDCTLDYEEEEDEYDKVAVGKEKAMDVRLFMKNVNDYGIDIDSSNVLPNSFEDVIRDPRANHIAAKHRLKEDAETAKKMDSLRVSEVAIDDQINTTEDGSLKSILKRKDDQLGSKSHNNQLESKKRVRFDPECKNDHDEESELKDIQMETDSVEEATVYPLPPNYPSGIPDYMRNPSKYTRYTFDSSDVNEESNRQAYMDFLKMLKGNVTDTQLDEAIVELPKSLTFIPKRKTGDATMAYDSTESKQNQNTASEESIHRRVLPVGIAAGDTEDGEPCAMDEDEPEAEADSRKVSQRSGRKYRTKGQLEMNEST